ncbi:hypothetical protein [Endozoicomonas atrinae]|uniref:hypothetical protein n=1 Tax=Endozoicomonas atrinae TaxID=1333660 RepID=UPI003B00E671
MPLKRYLICLESDLAILPLEILNIPACHQLTFSQLSSKCGKRVAQLAPEQGVASLSKKQQ